MPALSCGDDDLTAFGSMVAQVVGQLLEDGSDVDQQVGQLLSAARCATPPFVLLAPADRCAQLNRLLVVASDDCVEGTEPSVALGSSPVAQQIGDGAVDERRHESLPGT